MQEINDKVLHYAGKPKMRVAYKTLDVAAYDVCFPFVVYHKATAVQMRTIFGRHQHGHLPSRKAKDASSGLEWYARQPPPDLSNLSGKNSWVEALLQGQPSK